MHINWEILLSDRIEGTVDIFLFPISGGCGMRSFKRSIILSSEHVLSDKLSLANWVYIYEGEEFKGFPVLA